MGLTGTDLAREASLMILLDDSFASIVAAVELGRSVYQNIRKFLIYLFSHNLAELAPILVATLVGFPLVALSALQVLSIGLGSDVMPALALGAERPEPGIMDRPPRSPSERLFSAAVIRRFLFLGTIQAVGVVFLFLLAQSTRPTCPTVDSVSPTRRPRGADHGPGGRGGGTVLQRLRRPHRRGIGVSGGPALERSAGAGRVLRADHHGVHQLLGAAAGGVPHRSALRRGLADGRGVRWCAPRRRRAPKARGSVSPTALADRSRTPASPTHPTWALA